MNKTGCESWIVCESVVVKTDKSHFHFFMTFPEKEIFVSRLDLLLNDRNLETDST